MFNLATSITGAYFEVAVEPVIVVDEREALWHALIPRIAGLLVAGHTYAEVGSRVGETIEKWESKHRVGQGPHHFIVTSPREVTVAQ